MLLKVSLCQTKGAVFRSTCSFNHALTLFASKSLAERAFQRRTTFDPRTVIYLA